jgi:4-hydroxybenzoyl-CoA reductase beta subunit
LRLPPFEYDEPRNLGEALTSLAEHGERAKVIAGGTDLIVRMKQRLDHPEVIISLKELKELNYIREENGHLRIGALTPLASLLESDPINRHFQALSQAARLVGAPPIQHFRGTIGGNLCLQTRCLFYNQSSFWRSGRSRCHKDGGEICYAEENSDRCRSANQSDGACALMGLDATIIAASVNGERRLSIEEFFTGRGEEPLALNSDEMVTEIQVDLPEKGVGSSFKKLTFRSAVDFALVSAAAMLWVADNKIASARLAVGGAGAAPLLLKEASETMIGKDIGDIEALDETFHKVRKHASAFMVDNLGATVDYRQKMSAVMAKRAVLEAIEKAL